MALTAATSGLIYLFLARRYGRLAGVNGRDGPWCWPRGTSPTPTMPTTTCRSPASGSWRRWRSSRASVSARWIVPFGILLGLAAGTKFTGWFAVVPPMGWWADLRGDPLIVRLSGTSASMAGLGSPAAAPVAYRLARDPGPGAGHPARRPDALRHSAPLVAETDRGVSNGSSSRTSRERTRSRSRRSISGTVYRFALPWHNTIVLTAITTPVLIVVLGLVGIVTTLVRARTARDDLIWPLSWSILMIVRALPNAPGHDVERLLLPSIASLSVLAGIGVGWLADRLQSGRLFLVAPVVAGLAIGECLLGIVQTYPYNLSYYNLAVGGLPGAERLGFEETYYLETIGPEFLTLGAPAIAGPAGGAQLPARPVEYHDPPRLGRLSQERQGRALEPDGASRLRPPAQPGHLRPLRLVAGRTWPPDLRVRRQGVDLLRVYPFAESSRPGATRGQPGLLQSSQRPTWGLP